MAWKITIDRDGCIGCGSCAAICSENFEIADDGKSKVKKAKVESISCNQDAADSCPVGVIKIEKA